MSLSTQLSDFVAMTIKIEKKIINCSVVQDVNNTKEDEPVVTSKQKVEPESMHENIERPEMLSGTTYRLKTPLSDHALFITINDMVFNAGDEELEYKRPFEIFINSKNMEHFQWIVALTRILSAVFRKGGDIIFMIEELNSVWNPSGGYFKRGKYVHSLVNEIGGIIELHLTRIGMIEPKQEDPNVKAFITEKKAEIKKKQVRTQVKKKEIVPDSVTVDSDNGDYPSNATLCPKCHCKSLMINEGCCTCLNGDCMYSKCG